MNVNTKTIIVLSLLLSMSACKQSDSMGIDNCLRAQIFNYCIADQSDKQSKIDIMNSCMGYSLPLSLRYKTQIKPECFGGEYKTW